MIKAARVCRLHDPGNNAGNDAMHCTATCWHALDIMLQHLISRDCMMTHAVCKKKLWYTCLGGRRELRSQATCTVSKQLPAGKSSNIKRGTFTCTSAMQAHLYTPHLVCLLFLTQSVDYSFDAMCSSSNGTMAALSLRVKAACWQSMQTPARTIVAFPQQLAGVRKTS